MILLLARDHTGTLTLPTETRAVRWQRITEDAITATGTGARFDIVVDVRDLFPSRAAVLRWGGCGTVDGETFAVAGGAVEEGLRVDRVVKQEGEMAA